MDPPETICGLCSRVDGSLKLCEVCQEKEMKEKIAEYLESRELANSFIKNYKGSISISEVQRTFALMSIDFRNGGDTVKKAKKKDNVPVAEAARA